MELGRRFDLIPAGRHDILWVVEFPAFFWDAEAQRWDAAHHPFTAPSRRPERSGEPELPRLRPRARRLEIGGGSIRINRLDVQERVFELLGIGAEEAQARFGFLLDALRYGAPPHGGIAMGIDRIVAAARRARVDPRRDRLPQGGQRRRSAHRRARAGRAAQLRELGCGSA